MEHDPVDLVDPIAEKLRDNETIDRLVRQAVKEAVERARKLGFLENDSAPQIKQTDLK